MEKNSALQHPRFPLYCLSRGKDETTMTQNVLQGLVRQLPIGYAVHRAVQDSEGTLTDFIFLESNPAFEQMTGLPCAQLAGKPVSRVTGLLQNSGFNWAALYQSVLCGALGKGEPSHAELRGRWYKISSFTPSEDFFVLLLQDVTEEMHQLQQVEKQKQELEALSNDLEVIFNSTHDAMFWVGYDGQDFHYIRNNLTHQQLTGYSAEAFVGTTPKQLLGETLGQQVEQNYRRCIDAQASTTYHEMLTLPGGTRDWLTNLSPVWQQGKIRYLVGSRTDITELKTLRKENEGLLASLEAMFTDHNAAMLMIHPETGRILQANPSACSFYGYTHSELLQMTIQDINALPAAEVQRRRMQAYHNNQKYFLFPHRLKSGEIRMVDVYTSPVSYLGQPVLFSILFDVTDREEYRRTLFQERELLHVTLHSIGDGVITTDNDGNITSLNKAAAEVSGWQEQAALGKHFTDIIQLQNNHTGKEAANPIRQVLQSGTPAGLEAHTVLRRRDGGIVPINDSAAPIRNEKGKSFGAVMVFRDISHDAEQQSQILYLSYHDPLTGLHNRRHLEEQLKRLDTPRQLPLTVIMGDVNGLKITNDVFGHEKGDLLLKKVAETLQNACRKNDVLARWGGDEFLMLLPHTSQQEADRFITRVKRDFNKKNSDGLQLSVSLGCSVKTEKETDIRSVMREAEEWMYHQKLLESQSYRNSIINTLLATLYEKSTTTEEHAKRLKEYCVTMGKALQLNAEDLNELALLAVLHDIGKVGIHQSILQKDGPLNGAEWADMKQHVEIGYRIAQNTPELSSVSEHILSHHERWDGSGYPRGLKGQAIPLFCRILSVADAYDAMTYDRSYRKALPTEQAKQELMRGAGEQFDPDMVRLFLKLLQEGKIPTFP